MCEKGRTCDCRCARVRLSTHQNLVLPAFDALHEPFAFRQFIHTAQHDGKTGAHVSNEEQEGAKT